ncbi:MAG: hypothetical protein ACOC22_03155 [bacterium]
MIDMRYKPPHLPQISAPYQIVLEKLRENDIDYQLIEIKPDELETSQGVVFSDEVSGVEVNDNKPIWVGQNLNVLDGHHRWIKALSTNTPIIAIKINMNDRDASRLLNKIQDIYEYQELHGLEEIGTVQNSVNTENNIDSDGSSRMNNDFLSIMEDANSQIHMAEPTLNPKTIQAYRKDPIKDDSVVGNFFLLKPVDGFDKYEIEFDNLLDTEQLGLSFKRDQEPIDVVAKFWFPNINFEKLAEIYKTTSNNIKNKAIAEKARRMNYDGIKFGESYIQGLK